MHKTIAYLSASTCLLLAACAGSETDISAVYGQWNFDSAAQQDECAEPWIEITATHVAYWFGRSTLLSCFTIDRVSQVGERIAIHGWSPAGAEEPKCSSDAVPNAVPFIELDLGLKKLGDRLLVYPEPQAVVADFALLARPSQCNARS